MNFPTSARRAPPRAALRSFLLAPSRCHRPRRRAAAIGELWATSCAPQPPATPRPPHPHSPAVCAGALQVAPAPRVCCFPHACQVFEPTISVGSRRKNVPRRRRTERRSPLADGSARRASVTQQTARRAPTPRHRPEGVAQTEAWRTSHDPACRAGAWRWPPRRPHRAVSTPRARCGAVAAASRASVARFHRGGAFERPRGGASGRCGRIF